MDKAKILEHFEIYVRNLSYRIDSLEREIEVAKAKRDECIRERSDFQSFKDFITKAL